MSSMLKLIGNENMKIYLRYRTWIMLGALPAAVIVSALIVKFALKTETSHVLDFMAMCLQLSSLAFIFAVIVAGDIVASEYTWGTIKLLLIRPVKRHKLLLAKYAAVLLFVIAMLVLLLVSSYFVGLVMFGASGDYGPGASLGSTLLHYFAMFIEMVMSVTLAFMISSAFRSSSLAIGLSIFLMFTAKTAVSLMALMKVKWVKYILFANTDLSPYLFGQAAEGMTAWFSVSMLLLYGAVMYGVAWLLFTKRDVAG